MEVKANVQRRRQSRLRELQSRNQEQPGAASAPVAGQGASPADRWVGPPPVPGQWPDLPASADDGSRGSSGAHPGLPLYMRGQPESGHGGDPELAWKERQKQLLAWYAEEERNGPGGGPSERERYNGHSPGRGPFFRLFQAKLVLAGVLFAGVWGMFQWDAGWTRRAQAVVTEALTQEMDFSRAAAWYQSTFSGAPSFLPAFGERQNAVKVQAPGSASLLVQPVRGTVIKPFSNNQEGIWLAVKPDAQVAALDQGRVEFAGPKEGFGYLVTIRHSGGLRVSYGGLKPAQWQTGDWVKAGEVISHALAEMEAASANVYLAVMKDERFIDPLDVVTFD
ncbi:peptidoglycan DD-metalloendopeptidase family protein [Paenibacillus mesotrionivorans]|uniref:Peptidoglycan DD-metalloendopeptidase family protein n=1 Tax=Paenibacillus mesotrionivorans TaxID=3160968 RepID=A0ACC7P3I3_9BACL